MMVEIVKDYTGTEFKVTKKNRVNWLVERLSDGVRLQGNGRLFMHVRFEEEKAPQVDPRIRIGAVVKIKSDAPIRTNHKFPYSEAQKFVIIGFGKTHGDFKAINLGGNDRNTYWDIPGSSFETAY